MTAPATRGRHAQAALERKVHEPVAVRIPRVANAAWDWVEKNAGLAALSVLILGTLTAGLVLAHLAVAVGALIAGLVVGSLVAYAAMRVAGAHQRDRIAELEKLNKALAPRVLPPVVEPDDGPTVTLGIAQMADWLRRHTRGGR